ncbi:TPA: MARTX multifunctional-autoprocessing repeats-in-toxin holotoxin RtxA, partial [Yersinia enterocolitica]|nr:MARTX multifunctional-autoprocessing repeats-in-toxin holotoxin RtxA [Yersinia enterocolitica]
RIKNIFILRKQIVEYTNKHPTSGRNKAFLTLGAKIDAILFNSKMQSAKNAIILLAEKQPEMATRLYEIAVRESQGTHTGLTNMMHDLINEDGYLAPLKGFEGKIPDRSLLNFDPTYHISMGDQFDECKTKLLQAQSNGELRRVYINESTRSFTIGYSYEEMASFRAGGSDNSQYFSYMLSEVGGKHNGTDRSKELNWLDNCADKNFLKKLQISRLDQIESIYQRNQNIDFASWDSKYSDVSRDSINRELDQHGDVDGQLSVLLRVNQGLLIGEVHGSQEEGRRFVIEKIAELKRHGVTTIGLEHLRRDNIQPLIDDYYKSGIMSPDLNTFLTVKGVKKIVTTAFENKIKIVCLDDNSTSRSSGGHSLMYRVGSANNVAIDILKQIPAKEKFVVIYGGAHLTSHVGMVSPVSGISHQMKLPILKVDSNNRFTVNKDDLTQRIIYPGNNTTDSSRIVFPATLSDTNTKRNTRQSVDNWEVANAKSSVSVNFSQYNGKIIVQLENDPIAAKAAANLAAKHPGSILVQLDSDGQYRVISGDPTSLQGNIRWQLVGHGRDNSNGQGNQTMANSSPVELAARVKNLQDKLDDKYPIKSTPNYISLVGCTLVDKTHQHDFARQFITALNNQGIQADVAARSSRVLINEQGQKITLDADGNFRHKANEDKVILRLNKEQQIETVSEKVRNNIHVSEIDIHRVGAKDIDLPAGGAIGRNTEEFSPPERKKRIDTLAPSTDNNQAVSYSGNINIQIGDNEFTSINYGTSNLGIKVGHGGFKTLVFGDNNIMIHIGDGMSKHSVNIGGYQAFEGVQVFMGTRNISFNHGHSNDLIFMTEKTVLSPPLVNPFDGSTRVCVALENIANEGNGGDWLQAQAQQWTLAGAKRYLNDLSALDSTSSVDYNSLIDIDSQLIRSGRGLKSDINATLNKKYNQWLGKQSTEGNISQVKTTKADKLRKLNDTLVFNIAVGGQGADIIVTNSNWNFTFGDNIASIMDVNLGSLFAISTQQVTKSGRVKTTMTYSIDDMPRQIKNQLINKLSLVESDMTLGDIFGVDYDAEGNIVSRTGEDIDGEKVLKEMLEVVAEFGGEKLKTLSDPQKLLNGLKANLNMGENAITSFAQTHGLQDKAPDEVGETATVNASGSTTTQPPEKTDQTFGFNSLNLPNLFATLFNKDKQTEMEEMGNNLKQNMTKDLLNMEEKTFDFLRNSGFLRGDGDLNWSLGNYNFTLGGHGNDLGAYLGDNNNFWGGKGDDTFYGMGISNVFTGGQGNDTGVLMGRENTMFGGAGDDITVLAGRINHADLGAGNDKAFIFGEAGTANMGDGDDYVVIAGNYNRTDGEQGQDYVVLMGNNNVAKLGEGNDHCVVFGNENTVSGDQGSDTIKLMGYSSVILGSDGNDHLIADVISKFSEFLGGEGDDILELGGYQNQFSGLDGVDSFIVSTSVIDCTVTDISREDKILINNVSWRDLWLQRNGYDLTILVRRPITDDSAQGDFERVGSVTFNDYFNGKRAAIVVSDKGINADPGGYEALADSAIDGLVQNMNNFSVSDEKSSFIGQMDTQIQQQIAGLWANTTRNAA